MSVEIDPVELGFHRPFTMEVSQILKIRNTNATPVAFKVKTTAPKQYCVRPNSGRIEPGKEVEVTVLLQAMKQEPPMDAKCRDKFLVQSVALTAEKEFTSISQIWQHVDDAEKSTVQEKKIRVVYLPQDGAKGSGAAVTPMKNGAANGALGNHETPETAPPAYSTQRSPSPEATYTPETRRSTLGPQSAIKKEEDFHPESRSVVSNSSLPAAIPETVEELKAALEKAQTTIASFANEAGLRARKVAKGETSNETVNNLVQQVQQAPHGVPPQIVAALCLLSFLLAYMFF